MRRRLAPLSVASVLAGVLHGCGGASPGKDGAVNVGDARAETRGAADVAGDDRPSSGDVPQEAPSSLDQRADQEVDRGDALIDTGPVEAASICTTQTVILGRGGTTSSCSFKVSSSIPRDRVNLTFGGR